jgi:hypothetical protein
MRRLVETVMRKDDELKESGSEHFYEWFTLETLSRLSAKANEWCLVPERRHLHLLQ